MAEAGAISRRIQLREAVAAAKLGHKVLARKLFRELVEACPDDEEPWLWCAALAETPEEATRCLIRVLDINPKNQQAMNALAVQRLRDAAARGRRAAACEAKPEPAQYQVKVEAPPAWHCPLCGAGAAHPAPRCPRCGCTFSVSNLDELASNRDVEETAVQEAIQRLLKEVKTHSTFDAHLNLARAYLNLNRSAEALPHLEKAAALNPRDWHVQQGLEKLRNRRLILAVDDSGTVRKIVAVTLERCGYRVLTASDGMQALARLSEQMPDLILLDITMPRMDGYQVCKTIKQNLYTRQIPIVMLSGKDGFFDKVKGKLAGATDYLTKPFQEEALVKAVERYMKPRQSRAF
jgi:twitching motility two-component system response regulator PilG